MIALALGSNKGDRVENLASAVRHLRKTPRIEVGRMSPVYESNALLPDDAPPEWDRPYLNSVIEIITDLKPQEVLNEVKKIEVKLGRKERERWAPREIDIDLLIWNHEKVDLPELTIPHVGLPHRPFFVLPLRDLLRGAHKRLSDDLERIAAKWVLRPASEVPFNTVRTGSLFTRWVGVLNITPDSFSDGGRWINVDAAMERAQELVADGASVLDVGAESTRPGAGTVDYEEEWRRLEPILKGLTSVPWRAAQAPLISLDSRNPQTIRRALDYGIGWINDVTGFSNPEVQALGLESDAKVVVMHSCSVPPTSACVLSKDRDPVEQIAEWGVRRIEQLENLGIPRERMIFDPGIGFGKTAEQNLHILGDAGRFHQLGLPILVGHSRKNYLQTFTNKAAQNRDQETAMVSAKLAHAGIDFLRVHDVSVNRRYVALAEAIGAGVYCREI